MPVLHVLLPQTMPDMGTVIFFSMCVLGLAKSGALWQIVVLYHQSVGGLDFKLAFSGLCRV